MNFKEALIAHLLGEKVEVKSASETHHGMPFAVEEWRSFGAYYHGLQMEELMYLASLPSNSKSFRLAPRTIRVNGVEVPAPERVAPVVGATYYIPTPDTEELWSERWNQCSDVTSRHIERGLVYLNKEDAIARAKAMLLAREQQ